MGRSRRRSSQRLAAVPLARTVLSRRSTFSPRSLTCRRPFFSWGRRRRRRARSLSTDPSPLSFYLPASARSLALLVALNRLFTSTSPTPSFASPSRAPRRRSSRAHSLYVRLFQTLIVFFVLVADGDSGLGLVVLLAAGRAYLHLRLSTVRPLDHPCRIDSRIPPSLISSFLVHPYMCILIGPGVSRDSLYPCACYPETRSFASPTDCARSHPPRRPLLLLLSIKVAHNRLDPE